MSKLAYGVLALALYTTLGGWFLYKAGVNAEKAANDKIITAYQEQQRKMVAELELAKNEREIVYDTKIKIIKEAVDPSKCKSTDAPAVILQQFKTRSAP